MARIAQGLGGYLPSDGGASNHEFEPALFQALSAGTVRFRFHNKELDRYWWWRYTDLRQALERHGGAAFELHYAPLMQWLSPLKDGDETVIKGRGAVNQEIEKTILDLKRKLKRKPTNDEIWQSLLHQAGRGGLFEDVDEYDDLIWANSKGRRRPLTRLNS
jgi:hypothetical protein